MIDNKISKLVIVQCRTGSTRLPGKILKDFGGKNLLSVFMERIKKSKEPDGVVIATTNLPEDDIIIDLCKKNNWLYFRGSTLDLLDRHYQCAKFFSADVVTKIPSDSPFTDPQLIDLVFKTYENGDFDYVSNLHPPTFPGGFDCEVFSFDALEKANQTVTDPHFREHVTFQFWQTDRYTSSQFTQKKDLSGYRLAVDYPEDFELVRYVLGEIKSKRIFGDLNELVDIIDNNKDIKELNSKYYFGQGWNK